MRSLDELVKFCRENNMTQFNAKDSGLNLTVSVPAVFAEEKSTSSTLYGIVKIMHTGRNRNGSNLTEDAAKKCLSSIAYKPLLANFCEIDGVKDFTSHDFEIMTDEDGNVITDENGNPKIRYIERQIGCFTARDPFIQYDDVEKHNFVYAEVAIPREYTDAAEIIERKKGTKVSAELQINEMSYNAKTATLDLNDVELIGCTCLGVNPDTGAEVGEGMKGAKLAIEDFSQTSTRFEADNKLIEVLEKLNNTLSNFNNNTTGKEEDAKVNKDIEMNEVTPNQEDEILVQDTPIEEVPVTETEDTQVFDGGSDGSGAGMKEEEDEIEDPTPEQEEENPVVIDDDPAPAPTKKKIPEELSVKMSDGDVKTFSLSLDEIQCALSCLVNETYGEADNTWYHIHVYADDNYLVMEDWDDVAYKQSYKRDGDEFSLVGERVSVKRTWVTESEENALAEMRQSYEAMKAKIADYEFKEEEDRKAALMSSEDYSSIFNTKEYKELTVESDKAKFDAMSSEELEKKLDSILLHYSKMHKLTDTDSAQTKKKTISIADTKKTSRYGNLFD